MSVKASELDNPEQDMDLATRETKGAIERTKKGKPPCEDELKVLRERIAAAKATTPKDAAPHCSDCYRRGWEAALGAVDG